MSGTLRERVEAGARFLDTVKPGWADKVDPDHLKMSSCYRCVLGQLYGDGIDLDDPDPEKGTGYWLALSTFLMTQGEAGALGFTIHLNEPYSTYGGLQPLWVEQIERRRQLAAV